MQEFKWNLENIIFWGILGTIVSFIIIKWFVRLIIANNRKLLIKYLKRKFFIWDYLYLHEVKDKFKDDEEIVKMIVQEIGYMQFQFASERLKSDENFLLELIDIKYQIIEYAACEYESVYNKGLSINGNILRFCPLSYRNNRDIVIRALNNMNRPYFHSFTSVREIIRFIPYPLNNDEEIASIAVAKDSDNFKYLSEELRNNKQILEIALRQYQFGNSPLEFASNNLKNDTEIVMLAIEKDSLYSPIAFSFASDNLKNNKQFVLEVVKKNGFTLKFASIILRRDFEVGLEAVKNEYRSFEFVSESLKNDVDFILESIKIDTRIKQYLEPKMLKHPSVKKALSKSLT